MKQWMSLLLAGMVGGVMVVGADYVLQDDIDTPNANYAKTVNHVNESPSNAYLPQSFITAAEISTPVVVSIHAEESESLAKQRLDEQRKSPSNRDFFSLDQFFNGNPFQQFYRQKGSGSGVIFSSDGFIVTNNHVVEFADNIEVTLSDGRSFKAAKIGTDPSSDLAVLKIEATDLPTMQVANSDEVRIGEWVLAVGNPFDYLTSTVTAGIVSAKGRDINIIKEDKSIEEFIQTDAAINPGNSGGALVDTEGRLIGINTAIATPTGSYAGYSFAIPSNLVQKIVKEIIETGDIERANLGVAGYNVDSQLKTEYNLNVDEGFYVIEVVSGSAAEFGGILPGDVIVELDGKKIKSFEDLSDNMKYGKVGDEMNVSVLRKGDKKNFKVRLRKSL